MRYLDYHREYLMTEARFVYIPIITCALYLKNARIYVNTLCASVFFGITTKVNPFEMTAAIPQKKASVLV